MLLEDPRGWFDDYLDALNRHDLEGVRGLIAPDVRRAHLPTGADAWLESLTGLIRAVPDVQWRRIHLVIEGSRLAGHLRVRGTRHPSAQASAENRRINAAVFVFIRLERGRATEWAGTEDGEVLGRLRP